MCPQKNSSSKPTLKSLLLCATIAVKILGIILFLKKSDYVMNVNGWVKSLVKIPISYIIHLRHLWDQYLLISLDVHRSTWIGGNRERTNLYNLLPEYKLSFGQLGTWMSSESNMESHYIPSNWQYWLPQASQIHDCVDKNNRPEKLFERHAGYFLICTAIAKKSKAYEKEH